jgi:two-component sensor histidine kinase
MGVQFSIHDAVAVRLSETEEADIGGRKFHLFLKGLHDKSPRSFATGVVALDGQLLASSHEFPARSRIEGRRYIAEIAAGEMHVIDRIVLEQSGSDALVASTGTMAGATSAAVVTAWPADELELYLSGLAIKGGHEAAVLRRDGRVLVTSRAEEPLDLATDLPVLGQLSSADEGVLTAPRPDVGQYAVVAFHAVEGLPLAVVYDISTRSVRNEWLSRTAPVWAFLAALGSLGYVLLGLFQDNIEMRLRRAADLERAAAAENLARFRRDLVSEMNHRIKNNLAIVASIIRIDARRKGFLEADDVSARLEAVAAVHNMLYSADDGKSADVGKLLEAIVTNPAVLPRELGVTIALDLRPDVYVDTRSATTVAMIVAEIVTNAVKHAFPKTDNPRLDVSMSKVEHQLLIVVQDNGSGLPGERGRRSGSELVTALASSAGIRVEVDSESGTRYRLYLGLLTRD